MPKIIISDITLTGHPESVRDALLLANNSLSESDVEIRNSGLSADLAYAQSVNAVMLVRSTTGASGSINTAKQYWPNIQVVMPAGSNSPGEVFALDIPQVICITGAGDSNNETADNIEFFAPDYITVEPDYSSFSNGFIAGQLLKIKETLSCSWWEARFRAIATSTRKGAWHEVDGYGQIDVDAAIAYTGLIPDDPFLEELSSVGSLEITNSNGKLNIHIDDVVNAEKYELYLDGLFLLETQLTSLTYNIKPRSTPYRFTYRAIRGINKSQLSIPFLIYYDNFFRDFMWDFNTNYHDIDAKLNTINKDFNQN